jgi:hypothetical protein
MIYQLVTMTQNSGPLFASKSAIISTQGLGDVLGFPILRFAAVDSGFRKYIQILKQKIHRCQLADKRFVQYFAT